MTSTADQFRNIFIGKRAKPCKCGSLRFHVPPHGGIVCDMCAPGASILDLIASGSIGKMTWQEFDPGFDRGANTVEELRSQVAAENGRPVNPYDRFFEDGHADRGAALPPPPQRFGITVHQHQDGRRVRLLRDQFIVSGVRFPAGREFTISYTFQDRFGVERASLLNLDGTCGIACCPMERVEVLG